MFFLWFFLLFNPYAISQTWLAMNNPDDTGHPPISWVHLP